MPKVACTAIKMALLASDGITIEKPIHAHVHKRWLSPPPVKIKLVFTFVRHPVARLLSSYFEKLRTGRAGLIDPRCKLPTDATFSHWVDYVTANPQQANKHWQPQAIILGK